MKIYNTFCFFFLVSAIHGFGQVPTNGRSKDAIERSIPILNDQLDGTGMELGVPIFIRIFKEEHELELWIQESDRFKLFKIYEICTFSGDLGPKTTQGDQQSPEGFYFVNAGRMNPWSNFHLSMNVGYPNQYERSKGYTGDYLMIHGSCVSIGCYAMTDEGIEEIYTFAEKALNSDQSFFRVHIFPFRMTAENMQKHRDSEWYTFWENMRTGYTWFERNGTPPNVEVRNSVYVFN